MWIGPTALSARSIWLVENARKYAYWHERWDQTTGWQKTAMEIVQIDLLHGQEGVESRIDDWPIAIRDRGLGSLSYKKWFTQEVNINRSTGSLTIVKDRWILDQDIGMDRQDHRTGDVSVVMAIRPWMPDQRLEILITIHPGCVMLGCMDT